MRLSDRPLYSCRALAFRAAGPPEDAGTSAESIPSGMQVCHVTGSVRHCQHANSVAPCAHDHSLHCRCLGGVAMRRMGGSDRAPASWGMPRPAHRSFWRGEGGRHLPALQAAQPDALRVEQRCSPRCRRRLHNRHRLHFRQARPNKCSCRRMRKLLIRLTWCSGRVLLLKGIA